MTMKRNKLALAVMSMALVAGGAMPVPVQALHSAPVVTVLAQTTNSAPVSQQTPAAVIETEQERFARLRGQRRHGQLLWDGKNRKPGERAHRRWRKRRSSGLAA